MRLRNRMELDALPYALGAIGLGVVTLVFRDFLLQWQPVPTGLPERPTLVLVSAGILILGGLLALWPRAGLARLLLPAFYLLWVVGLHAPVVLKAPNLGSLLGLAEILSLAAGGAALAAGAMPRLRPVARIVYGLCPLVFGASHLVYAQATAAMVPAWIPDHLFWAQATGAAHIAAGLAILSGVLARLATSLLALMCGLFVVLLHAPRVAAQPASRLEWTMLFVALSIAGAAWLARRWLRR